MNNNYSFSKIWNLVLLLSFVSLGTALAQTPPPVAIAATSVTSTSFVANWNEIPGASYNIRIGTSTGSSNIFIGYVGLSLSYFQTNLSPYTTYYYSVQANAGAIWSTWSNEIIVTSAPAAPTATAATSITSNSFSANWNASTGATGYRLDVGTTSGGTDIVNNLDAGNVLTSSVTGLTSNRTYYYRVRAYNVIRTSPNSGTIIVASALPTMTATAATNVTQFGFTLNWNAFPGATAYVFILGTTPGGSEIGSSSTSNNYFALPNGRTPNTTYYYKVNAYSGNTMISDYSNNISVTTAPPAPTSTAATSITSNSFSANWNASTGATGYRLDVGTSSGGTQIISNLDVGNVLTNPVTGLTANTNYYYQVRAYNANGTSTNSGTITVTTALPTVTANAATSISSNSFVANWTAFVGATNYRFQVGTTPGGSDKYDMFVSAPGISSTANSRGISPNTTYYYRIQALDGGWSVIGDWSNNISVTTLPPAGPTSLPATNVTTNSFSANWNAAPGATSYILRVGTSQGGTNVLNDFNVGNVLTYSVASGVNPLSVYYYQVYAVIGGVTSASSNAITVYTPSVAPVAANASLITTTGFTANWLPPNNPSFGIENVGKEKNGLQVISGTESVNKITYVITYRLDVSTSATFDSFVTGFNDLNVSSVTTYLVTGLAQGTTYYYRVRAYAGVNSPASANSNVISVTTLSAIPLAPAAYNASFITLAFFYANWGSSVSAAGYLLDVSTDETFTTLVSGFNSKDVGNVLTFLIAPLNANKQYYYRVRAYNDNGTSSNSNVITAITLLSSADVPVATPATSVSSIGFNANWNVSATATGYFLDVAKDNSFAQIIDGYNNLSVGNVLTKAITGLTASTTYFYRIRGSNTGGASVNSNAIGQKTWGLTPNPPSNIVITFDVNGHPILTWTNNSNEGNGFDVYRDTRGSGGLKAGQVNAFVKIGTVPANTTNFVDATAVEGISYTYSVVATRTDGANSGLSSPSSQTPVIVAAPAAPSNLNGVAASGKITLTWTENSTKENGDIIERSVNTNTSYTQIGTVTAGVNSFVDLNVQNGVTYYYRMKAYLGTAFSIYSNESSVKALVTDVQESYRIPVAYRLFQNYPNPFNPGTMIRYAIPSDGKVKLTIYNLIGQEVTTLVDKNQSAGYHEVQFDATILPSGIYLYKIQTSNFVSTKKMILLK